MTARIACRMVAAEVMKVGHKRGTVAWATALAVGSLVLLYLIGALQHASNPTLHGPPGGMSGFANGIEMLGVFLGPLAAVLIGAEAGTGDQAAGVFRELVATGRSRAALFTVRIPGALVVCAAVVTVAYAVVVLATIALAGGQPQPSAGVLVEGLGWSLLVDLTVCAVAVGMAAATVSRPATITALIGFELIASPLMLNSQVLGSSRKLLLDASVLHFAPALNHGAPVIDESAAVAAAVMVAWVAAFAAAGLWRTRTIDA